MAPKDRCGSGEKHQHVLVDIVSVLPGGIFFFLKMGFPFFLGETLYVFEQRAENVV